MLQRRLLVICVASSALTLGLALAFRLLTGSPELDFLVWNLALAWVPLVAALALDDVRSTPLALQLPLLALWLAFLPNAPYLVTDLIHIDSYGYGLAGALGVLGIAAAAPTGLALGFSSLALVERSLRERFGRRFALTASVVSIVAASVGVYLGRVVRLNSWDLLTRPRDVAGVLHQVLLDPLAHADGLAGTVVLAAVLAACYLRFRRAAADESQAGALERSMSGRSARR